LCILGAALFGTLTGPWRIVGLVIAAVGVAAVICGLFNVRLPGPLDDDERRIRSGLDSLIAVGEHFHGRMATEELNEGDWNWHDSWRQAATDFVNDHMTSGHAVRFHYHADVVVPAVPAGTPDANQQPWRHMFIYLAKLREFRAER
jgi:hypothetical protein